MKYYLGIDGGGTKTKLCIIDENDNIIGISESGPSSIDTVNNNVTYQNFLIPLQTIVTNHNEIKISKVFCGIGGIVSKDDELLVENIIKTLPYITEETIVTAKNDMYNALYSGLLFDEGMALIVGTGCVAFGKTKDSFHKCSGWGYKEGDAGSAYDLGYQAIKTLVRFIDGRITPSVFTEDLKAEININSTDDIVPIINELWENRTKIASFAKLVTKHANLGDMVACRIVDQATDELTLAIKGVYNNLEITNHRIVIVGSLGNSEGYFKNTLHQKIKLINPKIQIIAPLVDPALGAALKAKSLK